MIYIPGSQEPFEPFERSRHGIVQLVRLLSITADLQETFGGLLPAHAFGAAPFAVWKEKSTAPSAVSEIGGLHSAIRILGCTIWQPNRNRTGLGHELQGY
jgi:hypothetical protein